MAPARIHEDTSSTTSSDGLTDSSSSFADTEDKLEPVAIVGFSIKFPQDAVSPQSFWTMLTEARSAMTDFPKDRFNLNSFYHPDANRHDTINHRGGHFIQEDLGAFDAPFFSITSAEAASMDPQQRILLETAYRALENAGIPMERAAGSKTSVYIGNFTREYTLLLSKDPELATKYTATSLESSMLANRLSWFYDLIGPSVCLDTACSSSLMALHLACQGLRSRESTMGLVGGCNLFFNPESSAALANQNFLSVDSRCHSFDHRANGYSRGEGFGVLVIKLLADAIRDGDTIRAIIRATGSNHDGKTPSTTQPSRAAQEALIRNTYSDGGLDLKITRYFEAHGTGTAVGDPIEASAIGAAFRNQRARTEPLYIGAVKANIGHSEATSGIAGIVKAIMVLERGVIPPNFGFEYANPRISTKAWNIEFPTKITPWPSSGLRRASVNSFGFGGSNVHVVLDDAFNYLKLRGLRGNHCTLQTSSANEQPATNVDDSCKTCSSCSTERSSPQLIVFSASDETGVIRLANSYRNYLLELSPAKADATYLQNIAYTMGIGRSSLPWKSFTIAESVQQLGGNILTSLSKALRSSNKQPKLGFIFTGQGAQTHAMGRELMVYSVFQASLQAAESYFKEELGCAWSLLEECSKDKESSNIDSPNFSQPICTALQIALVDLLRSWGVSASAVVGHSSGEIAAAYCAGGLSRESAWKVAYHRGALAARLTGCDRAAVTMMAVGLSADEAQAYIDEITSQFSIPGVTIGCINSPKNVTVTGSEVQIDALRSRLNEKSIFARKLRVNVAYHSSYMNEVAAEYRSLLEGIKASDQAIGFPLMVSSVTGSIISIKELSQAEYWIKNMVSPVLFSDAIYRMCWQSSQTLRKKLGARKSTVIVDDLVEIGPHSALQGPINDVLKISVRREDITYSSMLVRNSSALFSSLEVAGRLYCLGYHVKLCEVNRTDIRLTNRPMILPDLPEYPFNHSQTYWLESRLSKNFRFRGNARSLFLGSTAPEWNSLEARWRNIIRASENPWIADHKISGAYIYPGAGMLVMAIEAAQQISDTSRNITGYRLRNITFSKALNINLSPEGVETQFYMRRLGNSKEKSTGWNEFRLCSYDNGEWFDNCQGNIAADYELAGREMDAQKEQEEQSRSAREAFQACVRDCGTKIDPNQMYSNMQDWGYGFGPTFRVLGSVSHDNERNATATISIKESLYEGKRNDLPSVIHPTSLDGIMQLSLLALSRGGTKQILTNVPTRIEKLWIANSRFYPPDTSILVGCAKTVSKGFRELSSKVYAFDKAGKNLCVSIEGFEATAVAGNSTSHLSQSEERRLCYSIEWKPDIDICDKEQLLAYCEAARPVHASPIDFIQDLESLCFISISQTLEAWNQERSLNLRPHLKKYVEWMRYQSRDYLAGKLSTRPLSRDHLKNLNYQDELLKRVEDTNIEGSFYAKVIRNIQSILSGETDALHFFLQGDLVSDFYCGADSAYSCFKVFGPYLDSLAHKNPGMRILEIGAGTGGATNSILETLVLNHKQEPRVVRYASYDFTDISPSFFENAKEKFYAQRHRMNFATLDIEGDPIQQGFDEGAYDLIVASNVLHATKNLGVTLRNTRRLLKTGGRLVLFEVTNPKILRTGLAFGLLPGWWLSTEKNRQAGPCMVEKEWHETLSRNGFSGTDLIVRDYHDDRCHETSIMVSTASGILHDSSVLPAELPHGSSFLPRTVIVTSDEPCALQIAIAQELRPHLEQIGVPSCEVLTIQELDSEHNINQALCIFLPETQAPFLLHINAEKYSMLKMVMNKAKGLLWATKGGGISAITPESELVKGLSRTVCSENRSFVFVTMALDDSVSSASQNVANILKVFMRTALTMKEPENCEMEYEERDGMVFINRAVEDHTLNHDISLSLLPQQSKSQRFGKGPPLTLTITSPGLLDSLKFVNDACFMYPLGSDEIEIEVTASGTSFMDILVALGRVSGDTLGIECAGIVRKAGRDADFRPGDRVCAITFGTYKSYVRCKTFSAFKVPDDIPLQDAAALPIVSTTAYYALYVVARMTHKDSILIHCGAGGTGQAAIQISKLIGAEIYTTVGSEEKKKLVVNLYGIPEDHIFYSRDLSFAQGVKRMTQGRGVDVILNSLAGEGLVASWECIAPFGRFIEIGKKDIFDHGLLPMFPFARNVSFAFVDIAGISQERPEMLHGLMKEVMGLVEKKKICAPQPLHIYGVSEVEKAFRYLQSGKNTGKIVIEMREDDIVQTVLNTESSYHFEESATYVISGGLGGVGRSIARWMTHRGAKNLILLSRSGPRTEAAMMLCKELKGNGVHLEAPACDVTKADSLSSVLAHCAKSMPPIKGCIQASMVLKDSIFETMSREDFNAALDPKVIGSWNLHTHLPMSMDFFILLSSVSGVIGNRGQANYASGNTYQDALARHRIALGEKAVAIDLGSMLGVGLIAENKAIKDAIDAAGFFMGITEAELHAILDRFCDPALEILSPQTCQVVMGLETPASLKAKNIDEAYWMTKPLFRHFHQMGRHDRSSLSGPSQAVVNLASLLRSATKLSDASAVVAESLVKKLSKSLSTPEQDIDTSKPLHLYGVDSLVAVELRSWFAKELNADIAIFDIMGGGSIAAVSSVVASKSLYWTKK